MTNKDLLKKIDIEELKGILEDLGFEFNDKRVVTGGRVRISKDSEVNPKGSTLETMKPQRRQNAVNAIREIDAIEVEEGYNFYAIAARTGYGLYTSASNCANQLNYYRDVEWKGFEFADDAMDWIESTVPRKAHIRGHEFCSLDYMLKHQNYWFSRGKEE